ncbi:uncharacterized protein BKA78DRAFT_155568 [Phyllosticta capitalensis]|uniref:uncharacterized protein n=1 Tax=Phyllosticta capitalensis TaxID=121624 RepID=UPI003130EBDE
MTTSPRSHPSPPSTNTPFHQPLCISSMPSNTTLSSISLQNKRSPISPCTHQHMRRLFGPTRARTHPLSPTTLKQEQKCKTYNSRDSLLVTHATTNRPQGSLSMEERTGFRVFYLLWSYVEDLAGE